MSDVEQSRVCDGFATNVLNLYRVLQRNGPWPKINLSNTWTCAWLWWTGRPGLSSSCKAVEKMTADRWVHTWLRPSSRDVTLWTCGGAATNVFVVRLIEMGANWVQLEASSRGQQPVPGQPQRQDGRPHRGGLQPQPQPAVEVHPQFTIIGGATDPPGESEITGGDTDRLWGLQREIKRTGGKRQLVGSVNPSRPDAEAQPVQSVQSMVPSPASTI